MLLVQWRWFRHAYVHKLKDVDGAKHARDDDTPRFTATEEVCSCVLCSFGDQYCHLAVGFRRSMHRTCSRRQGGIL